MHRLICAFALNLFAFNVFGHGPAPAAISVLVDEMGSVRLVQTNIGLAMPLNERSYAYLCPILWGEEDHFPMPLLDDANQVFLPVNGVLYQGEICDPSTQRLDAWSGYLSGQSEDILLERVDEGSRIWQVGASPAILYAAPEAVIDSVLKQGDGVLLGTSRGEVSLARIQPSGNVEPIEIQAPPTGDFVSLRMADPIWFVLTRGDRRRLFQVLENRVELRVEEAQVIHGPVSWMDGVVWIEDGRLKNHSEGVTKDMGTVDWKCLAETQGLIYACSNRNLLKVVPNSLSYELYPLFELDWLTGPDSDCLSGDSPIYVDCQRQWYHYAGEAGLLAEASTVNTQTNSSCQMVAEFKASLAVLLLCIMTSIGLFCRKSSKS